MPCFADNLSDNRIVAWAQRPFVASSSRRDKSSMKLQDNQKIRNQLLTLISQAVLSCWTCMGQDCHLMTITGLGNQAGNVA